MKFSWLSIACAVVALSNILTVNEPIWALPKSIISAGGNCETPLANGLSILRELSTGKVYLARLKNETFVIRVPVTWVDIRFEAFANQFVKGSNVQFPELRLLSVEETKFFLQQLKNSRPRLHARFVRRGGLSTGAQASIAEFKQGLSGESYLNRIGFSDLPLQALQGSKAFNWKNARGQREERDRFKKYWRELSSQAQTQILKILGPELSVSTGDALIGVLLEQGSSMTQEKRERIADLLIAQIPASIMVQIADAWALYTVLGIPDFHPRSWLISDGRVIGIDMTETVGTELTGDAKTNLEIVNQQSPLGGGHPPHANLVKRVSKDMIAFLSRLSLEQIQRLAEQSHYQLDDEAAEGILARARTIIQHQSSN